MKEYVRTSHLVYIIIISIIVLSFFLVIAFGGTDNASTTMGTASTVSSLILSVIAIVLSLVDVAGQRQSMIDLKETADKLYESNESASFLIQDLTTKMVDLQEIKEQMIDAVKESDEWRKDLVEKIESIKQKGDIKTEDLEGIIKQANDQKFNKFIKNLREDEELIHNSCKNYYNSLPYNTNKAIQAIQRRFSTNNAIMQNELIKFLMSELEVSRVTARRIYNSLLDNNYIESSHTPTGEYEIMFTEKILSK